MKVGLLANRRVDKKLFALLAHTGENLLALGLAVTLFTRLFLMRPDFAKTTLLPGLAWGVGLACLVSAAFARRLKRQRVALEAGQEGSVSQVAPCALPVGVNRWFLILLCLMTWFPCFREGRSSASGVQTWQIACSMTVTFGLVQILAAGVAHRVLWFLEPASLAGLNVGLALAGLFTGPLPAILESPHTAIPVAGVLCLPLLGRLPLPFGTPSTIAALALGAVVAWGTGSVSADWSWSLPALTSAAKGGFALWMPWQGHPPLWWWAGLLLACHSALLDVAMLERAARSGDAYPKRSFLLVLGLTNVCVGFLGCCIPCAVLLGHSVYRRLGGGSVYVQATGLLMLGASLTGLLPFLLLGLPEAVWAPLCAWILISLCGRELEACGKGALATVCAILPIMATVLWMGNQGWDLGSDPDFSLLLVANKVGQQPWIHTLGIASLAYGAIATALLWGSITVCAQKGLMAHIGVPSSDPDPVPPVSSESPPLERRRRARGGPLPHGFLEGVRSLNKASWLAFTACLLTVGGVIHGPALGWSPGPLAAAYLVLALMCHAGYVVELERVKFPRRRSAPPPLPPPAEPESSTENPGTPT